MDRPETGAAVPQELLDRAREIFTAYRSALAEIRTDPYTGDLPNGAKSSSTDRLTDDDHREWSMAVKDADGKVVFEMTATAVRRK